MIRPKVSIIIVHYNGTKIIDNCLKSLRSTTYENYEVIIVDNNSTDESVDLITKKYCGYATLIRNKENLGFAAGNNIALRNINSDYVVLLNNDTEVKPDWLNKLVDMAEYDISIGALQPKLLSLRNPGYFDYNGAAGGYLDRYGYTVCRGRIFGHIEKDYGQYDDVVETFWAGGAAIFIRTKVLSETGLLDEDFYAHFEEIDLCWRIRLRGYRILCVPKSVVYHLAGGTANPNKLFLNHRNNLIMILKNYSLKRLIVYFPIRIIFDCVTIGYAASKKDFNWTIAILKSFLWIFANVRSIIIKRISIQKTRKVSDDEIVGMMTDSAIIKFFIKKESKINIG